MLVEAFGHFGFDSSTEPSIAWASILFEASIGPRSSSGTSTGHGNFVAANAMLKTAGKTIAASHRIVFHFNRFLFSTLFMGYEFFGCIWLSLREKRESAER